MALEEFNHFFQEEYFDLIVDNEVILEAYSKKEVHRINKFLKENNFREDTSATTAEEKRKGYRRGTIESDIPDENGKKRRVKFEITPHDADPGMTFKEEDEDEHKSCSITMSKRTLARKPAISNFIFKHEEGHAAIHLDKSGKYVMEIEKIDKILTRMLHKMLTNKEDALNSHDLNTEEFMADKYAKEHAKHQKTSAYHLKDSYGNMKVDISTKNAVVGLQTLLSDDRFSKKRNNAAVNFYKQQEIDRRMKTYSREEIIKIKQNMELCKTAVSSQIDRISTSVDLLNSYSKLLKNSKDILKQDEENLENHCKEHDTGLKQVNDLLKHYSEDLNNELIIARENGKILSKAERRKKVDEMYKKVYVSSNHTMFNYVAGKDKIDSNFKDSSNFYKQRVISSKQDVKYLTNEVDKLNNAIKEMINKRDQLKAEYKELEKEYINFTDMVSDKNKIKALDAYKRFADHAEIVAKMKVYDSLPNDDLSTTIRILMLLPKEDRDRFAKEVHDATIKVAKLEKENKLVTESYGPEEDHTTGTSEFDEPYNDDPDDCYCESSIFDDEDTDTEYDWLASKLDNEVSFWLEKCHNLWTSVPDIVYSSDSFGVDIIDYLPDDWELAVTTPDIWKDLIDQTIRCSNAILYTIDEFDKLDPEQKMKHEGVKFDHDELIENISQIIQLANNVKSLSIFNILDSQHVMSTEEKEQVNNVYEVGHLFKAIAKDWVSKYKPNRLRYFQEAYDAITSKEIPIDHAYTMDEMKERTYTEEELMNTIQEAKLPSKKRNKLPDSDFALVYTDANGKKIRKYPIHDEAHCKAAAHMFPRGVPLKYQGTVARKILRRAHKFGIDTSGWKNLNKFKRSDK